MQLHRLTAHVLTALVPGLRREWPEMSGQDQFPVEDPEEVFWEVILDVRRLVELDRVREAGKPR